ncbi:MAG: hypothetical protein JKY67_20950, partial [Pseudomonadales bacterium]|nr:hypothetical protein [Pseudomonadales bacterium]
MGTLPPSGLVFTEVVFLHCLLALNKASGLSVTPSSKIDQITLISRAKYWLHFLENLIGHNKVDLLLIRFLLVSEIHGFPCWHYLAEIQGVDSTEVHQSRLMVSDAILDPLIRCAHFNGIRQERMPATISPPNATIAPCWDSEKGAPFFESIEIGFEQGN